MPIRTMVEDKIGGSYSTLTMPTVEAESAMIEMDFVSASSGMKSMHSSCCKFGMLGRILPDSPNCPAGHTEQNEAPATRIRV
jgi:hypothetical protein